MAFAKDLKTFNPEDLSKELKAPIDIIVGGPPCFVAGTNVLTDSGYKNIEEVMLSDKLLSHTGQYRNILNLQRKKYSGELYSIKVQYHPRDIICTKEHPFYVRKKTDPPEWIEAKHLTHEYYFGMIIDKSKIDISIESSLNNVLNEQRYYLQKGVFMDLIEINDVYLINKNDKIDSEECFIEGSYAWFPLKKIDIQYVTNVNVYNFEVAEDNSYIVENVIAHNCQGFSMAGKRDIKDPRNSLFMEFYKYLNYYKPKAFIMENVMGILSMKTEKKENVIDIIMDKLNENYKCCVNKLYASEA